jgi:putative glutamine amidotransferase
MKFYLTTLGLVFTFILKIQMDANAATTFKTQKCKLPRNETITVGCTTNCGRFNTWALKRYARKSGYNVNVINIYSENQTPNLAMLDAILIPGGADINPKYYLPSVEDDLKTHIKSLDHLVNYTDEGARRDPFEYNLLKEYFSATSRDALYTPVLGICRGMQMLTVSQGIPLYVDIKQELGIKNRRYTLDKVTINNDESVIASLQKRKTFRGVEIHHQGLRVDYYNKHQSRWPQLEVTGTSHSGRIAEVLEFYNRPVLGVQFHPEYTFGKTRRSIFSWLLNRACIKKNITRKNVNKTILK